MYVENFNLALLLAATEVFAAAIASYTLLLQSTSYVERNLIDRIGYSGMTLFVVINGVDKLLWLVYSHKGYYCGWKYGIIIFLTLFLIGNIQSYRKTGIAVLWKIKPGRKRKPLAAQLKSA